MEILKKCFVEVVSKFLQFYFRSCMSKGTPRGTLSTRRGGAFCGTISIFTSTFTKSQILKGEPWLLKERDLPSTC